MSPKPATRSASSYASDLALRALAMGFVVLIHYFSGLHNGPYLPSSPWQWLVVGLDQLGRVCVPLFVALSGFGLSQKYRKVPLEPISMLVSRAKKLLPPYIIWSVVLYAFFTWVMPSWNPSSGRTLWYVLLWGRADYHLYFVPMLFQLYLVFPFIWWAVKRWPKMLLVLAGLFQVGWYWFLNHQGQVWPGSQAFDTDQEQYVWFFTWIWYFVLGMNLPTIHGWFKRIIGWDWWSLAALLTSWYFLWQFTLNFINSGNDPIISTGFTRWPVLLYASVAVVVMTWWADKLTQLPKVVSWLGKQSYNIYLTHTLVLRVLFWLWYR